jgi:DNA-binding NarL/FixJ family response regulator
MIYKQKNALKKQALAKKKKHLPYTSLGERQAMMLLHNLGKTNKEIASSLGFNASTVFRVLCAFKSTGSFSTKSKS